MTTPLRQEQKIVHFLNRTSFGPTLAAVQRANQLGVRAYLEEQLAPEAIADGAVEEKVAGLKTMRMNSPRAIRALSAAEGRARTRHGNERNECAPFCHL